MAQGGDFSCKEREDGSIEARLIIFSGFEIIREVTIHRHSFLECYAELESFFQEVDFWLPDDERASLCRDYRYVVEARLQP